METATLPGVPAGIGLAALIGGGAGFVARRFSSPVLRHG